jgi:hypothetical protein
MEEGNGEDVVFHRLVAFAHRGDNLVAFRLIHGDRFCTLSISSVLFPGSKFVRTGRISESLVAKVRSIPIRAVRSSETTG